MTDLGSILDPLKGRFRSFFYVFVLEKADSFEEGATSEKPRKTMFLLVFCISVLARSLRKSYENRSERASRTSRATVRFRQSLFSSIRASKWVLWPLSGDSRGALGALLAALGALLAALGALLGRS